MKVFKYFYSNRGPVIDYENQELVHFSLMNYQNMLKTSLSIPTYRSIFTISILES